MANPYEMTPQELLARTLMGEAGQESPQGQLAAASVMNNRVASPSYPNNINDVLMQKGQFSLFNDITGHAGGAGSNKAWQGDIPPELLALAGDVLSGNTTDPTGGALNYYNPTTANPAWGNDSFQPIGNHVFGTAGAGGGGGSSLPTGGAGLPNVVGGEGMDRFKSGLSNVLAQNSNSTIAAKQATSRGERARDQADKAREVFNTNAPTSWANVLGSVLNDVAGSVHEGRAANQQQQSLEQVQELMASGNLTPEAIAKITALNPQLGESLRQEAAATARDDKNFNRGVTQEASVYARGRADDVSDEARERRQELEDAENKRKNTLELETVKAGLKLAPDRSTEAERLAKRRYPDDEEAQIEYLMALNDPNNSAEVAAARADATANSAWTKAKGTKAAERFDSMTQTAKRAPQQLASLGRMENALNNTVTGTGSGIATTVGQLMNFVGLTTEDLEKLPGGADAWFKKLGATPESAASAEVIEAIANEMTTSMIGTDGFPANNFSDADRKFLQKIFPGMGDTEIGAMEKLANLRYRYEKAGQMQQAWQARIDGGAADTHAEYERFEADFNQLIAETADEDLQAIVYQQIEAPDLAQNIKHPKTPEEIGSYPPGTKWRHPETNKLMRVGG